jgi:hypothetical protein
MTARAWRSGVACVLAAVACAPGSGKRETSALLNAVDGYRRADTSAKANRVAALQTVTCSEPPVCDAKAVCVAAVEPTTRALLLKDEVAARLADIEQRRLAPDAPEASALPGKLDEAQRLLETGRQKMTECERRLSDLRVEYGS